MNALVPETRKTISLAVCQRNADFHGTTEMFARSQKFPDWQAAFDSWHTALWRWVDEETTPELASGVQSAQFNWLKIKPDAPAQDQQWDSEAARQGALLKLAVEVAGLRFAEAGNPEWYKAFAFENWIAAEVGDLTIAAKLAGMKQRKESRDKGDRQLKYALLSSWIGGCLWTLETQAVAEFLQRQFQRSETFEKARTAQYHTDTIRKKRAELKLYKRERNGTLYRIVWDNPPRWHLVSH